MEGDKPSKEKGRDYDVVVDIQVPNSKESPKKGSAFQENGGSSSFVELARTEVNLFNSTSSTSAQLVCPTQCFPAGPSVRQRPPPKSVYPKPKSRIVEPPSPNNSNPAEKNSQPTPPRSPYRNSPNFVSSSENFQTTPVRSPLRNSPIMGSPAKTHPSISKASAPVTPKTPLMASVGGDDDDEDDEDDEVYQPESLNQDNKKHGKNVKVLILIEWILFVGVTTVLIVSLTMNTLRGCEIWSLELWKWCVLALVIFCGRLFTEWLTNALVFLIEKNFLLKKKVLYFVFGLKKSVRVVIWLALILVAWVLLINRGVRRSEEASKVLNYITRGIVSTLVGAVMWMVKTLLVKLVASSFHVRTYFDRIQESIFHQYILQTLSGFPMMEIDSGVDSSKISGQLSFNKLSTGNQDKKGEVINVDKLYKIKREKVSAWTMRGLIEVIRNSQLPSISEVLDERAEVDIGEPKVITNEVEAKEAARKIFRNVAKPGYKYIDEDDLLRFMPKEEVDNAIPLFEGAAESRRIKKSSFRNWVVKAYKERKCLAVSLSDAKTAIEELNKIASGLVLLVIVIVWILLMEITTTRVLVFISSQLLLVVFMFGNTARTVFEALIFVFVVHPFDVGDRCVIDGVQMIVDEMNILTTIFLKPDNEKVYYPNSVLATKAISNFNRSPEMMGDTVEFAVDFSTSAESIAALRAKIKAYLESKPQHWSPDHSVQIREIVDMNKMRMALYVTHTINFQNSERGNRRSDLVFELKKILEEIGITYHLLPLQVQMSYIGGPMPTPARLAS